MLSDAQRARLLDYADLLIKWNRVYNLTSVDSAQGVLRTHLLDSLAVVPALKRHRAGGRLSILDVGSGGGLPGTVLAIADPSWQVRCVDAVGKKTRFVTQVAAELGLSNLAAVHARVEQIEGPTSEVITSRAFASLSDFTSWTRHLLSPGGCWLAMKARHADEEIRELPPDLEVFHVEHPEVPGLGAERCLVWIRPRH